MEPSVVFDDSLHALETLVNVVTELLPSYLPLCDVAGYQSAQGLDMHSLAFQLEFAYVCSASCSGICPALTITDNDCEVFQSLSLMDLAS